MKKILTYGSLRKDITFFVEFSELKTNKEAKSKKYPQASAAVFIIRAGL